MRPFERDEIAGVYESYNRNIEQYLYLDPNPIPIETVLSAFDSGEHLTEFSGHVALEFNSNVIGLASFRPLEKHIVGSNVGLALCDPATWNRGLGSLALVAFSRFLFESRRAIRLEWKCVSNHIASIRVAEKAGYIHEGISRSAVSVRGVLCDVTRLSLLVTDFAPHGQ